MTSLYGGFDNAIYTNVSIGPHIEPEEVMFDGASPPYKIEKK